MKYGYFDDKRREYVITRPDTPVPWYNYIRNDEWCGLVSNTGGGPSFHRDPKYRRFLRYRYNNLPADRPGRYVYLRDNDNGDYWSATWAPVQKRLDKFKYECRVGLNYTTITSRYDGIQIELTYFVAPDDPVELWWLTVTNRSRKRVRDLSTFSYGEMCVWGALRDLLNMDNGPRCTRVEYRDHAILNHTMNDLGAALGGQSWVTIHGYFTASDPPPATTPTANTSSAPIAARPIPWWWKPASPTTTVRTADTSSAPSSTASPSSPAGARSWSISQACTTTPLVSPG